MTKDEALRLALEALEKLWNIIDDIDTYSDMAKADEKLYRSLVERRQRQRFEETGISTDGYDLHGGAITAIKAALEAKDEKDGSPCPEFWDWLPKAYRDGDIGDLPKFTKYNMEVAFLAGKQSVALEAKDEPVAWVYPEFWQHLENLNCGTAYRLSGIGRQPLYTTPPQQEAKDEPVNDELRRLHDLLGKANALARIRAAEIESMKASLYGLYELEKQRDEFEQRLTKTEAQLGEAVWNYGELKREQLANQQNTSGSPIFSELHCICGAEWEWRNRDWELVATPPQRKPLTDEEIQQIFIANSLVVDNGNAYMVAGLRTVNIAQAIEAKLKEKNT